MANWAKLQEDTIQLPIFKRARHGIHFDKGNGEVLANFSGKPCHFQDTDGLWKPIDTKLLPLGDGFYGCPHSKVKVHPAGHVAVAGTDYIQRVTLPSAQAGLLDGDKLVRKFSFGEQRMWVTEDGFKSEIQLNRIPTLTEARKLIASESGTLSKEYLKSLTTATDANGNVHTYSTLAAFRTWLAGAKFPVVIDPDFAVTDNTDCGTSGYSGTSYAAAKSTANGGGVATAGYWSVGCVVGSWNMLRGFMAFDTSTIGSDGTVTNVKLKMARRGGSVANAFDVQIVKYNWSEWLADLSNATKRDTAADGCLAGDLDDNIWSNTSTAANDTMKYSGDLNTAWVSKTGTTYYGLRSSRDADAGITNETSSNNITIHNKHSYSANYYPFLTVTYTAGGSITPIVQYYNRLRRN